jgi:hypothetical protein
MADELLAYVASQDPWFQETSVGITNHHGIDPKVKLLLLLKILGYGVLLHVFIIQMGETTTTKSVKKICQLVRTSDELHSRFYNI